MSGELFQKTISKAFPISREVGAALEIVFLFLLGALAITLHAKMRIPLKIPGHHGLEFMALLAMGRLVSSLRWATVFSSFGVALMIFIPGMGFADPFMAFVYTLPGLALDLLFILAGNKAQKAILFGLLCGISYSLIPVGRIFLSLISGFQYFSLQTGFIFPIMGFFVFGCLGGLAGFSILRLIKK